MTELRAIDALALAVERMWPGSTVEVGPHRPGAEHEFVVLPRRDSARMLIPVDRSAAASAVKRYNAAVGAKELCSRAGLSLGLRAGGARLLPDRLSVVGARVGITDHLAAVLGEPVTVSIAVGTARANRKPVLGVFDARGSLIAYAKVGDTAVARGHVEGEAVALRTIAGVSWSDLMVPELLHAGEWEGMFVLVMSALSAPAWHGWLPPEPVPVAAMLELSAAFDLGTGPLDASPMFVDCVSRSEGLVDPVRSARLRSALDRVRELHGATQVRSGAWHGDFTPWNTAWAHGGRLMLWDWERFNTRALFGMDRLHYMSQTWIRSAGFSAESLFAGLAATDPGRHSDAARHHATVAAYVASLACRYLLASEGEGGEAIVEQAHAVLEVLERLVGVTEMERGR